MVAERGAAFDYVPVLSREPESGVLQGRLTAALGSGELERRADATIAAESSHFMLCGNPGMIEDVTALLAARGLRRHRQRTPGHITTEKYW